MKSPASLVPIVLALATGIAAQTIQLTGTVTNAAGGAALQNVIVALKSRPTVKDTTGADGKYTLTGTTGVLHSGSEPTVSEASLLTGHLLKFSVKGIDPVTVDVFTALGAKVASVFKNAFLAPGLYSVDLSHQNLAPGMYLVRYQQGGASNIYSYTSTHARQFSNYGNVSNQPSAVGLQKQAAAAVDSLIFTHSGYITKRIGVSSYSGQNDVALQTTTVGVPGAPANVSATAWPYTALVSFNLPDNDGGSAITSYSVACVEMNWVHNIGTHSPIMLSFGLGWVVTQNTNLHFTVSATNASGTGPTATTTNGITCTGTALNTEPFWIYNNGQYNWQGDFNFGLTSDWADTTGIPLTGKYDIKCTETADHGGCQPFAPGNPSSFNLAQYNYVTMCLKPTQNGQTWNIYFLQVGDINVGVPVDLVAKYGGPPVAGQWAVYNVPLADLQITGISMYKMAIHDTKFTSPGNVFYIDKLGFSKTPQTL